MNKKNSLHVINFSLGGISNREHNIFKSQLHGTTGVVIDQGGNSSNIAWMDYLTWLLKKDEKAFIKLLPLFVEFVGLRELTTFQIRTKRKSKKVESTWGLLKLIYARPKVYEQLQNLLEAYAKSKNPFKKHLVAKWLNQPRFSQRKGGRALQEETIQKMQLYKLTLLDHSDRMNYDVRKFPKNVQFKGFVNWRKDYSKGLEYVLFTTKKILEFDNEQFKVWLSTIPAGARYRVKRRLFDKDDKPKPKWGKLTTWFTEFEDFKKASQTAKKVLEQKIMSRTRSASPTLDMLEATLEEKEELKKLTKAAKVTTGAKTLADYVNDFISGKVDTITVEAIVDKFKLDVNLLVAKDCSMSMQSRKSNPIANLITTLAMIKNPTTEDLLLKFGSQTIALSADSIGTNRANRFMKGTSTNVPVLIDRTKTFMENYQTIGSVATT